MKHFSYAERKVLEELLLEGRSYRAISLRLHRSHTAVVREVARNKGHIVYSATRAQLRYERCLRGKKLEKLIQYPQLKEYIVARMKEDDLSPQMIAGRLKQYVHRHIGVRVSHETIYQFVYSREGRSLGLPQHLYSRRGRRFSWLKRNKPLRIPERVSIHERDRIVDLRKRIGDWESDAELFPGRKPTLSVETERKSRYVSLHKTKDKTAVEKLAAMQRTISALTPDLFKTMTFDNGTENVQHLKLRKEYGIQTYFCDPYKSWQKGTVENMNKWIRWYLPRDINIDQVTDEQIQTIQDKLNNKPRKCLNYLTPKEVLLGGAFNS
jgi:transposase, IS30 family